MLFDFFLFFFDNYITVIPIVQTFLMPTKKTKQNKIKNLP